MGAFFTTLLEKVLEIILAWVASRALKEVQKIEEKIKNDKSNSERNERNAVAYEQAKTRAEKIQAALDLVNRNN